MLLRGVLILAGAALIERFEWILYLFGVFLIFTAVRMLWSRHEPDPKNNLLVRLARRLFPITADYEGQHFVVLPKGGNGC